MFWQFDNYTVYRVNSTYYNQQKKLTLVNVTLDSLFNQDLYTVTDN